MIVAERVTAVSLSVMTKLGKTVKELLRSRIYLYIKSWRFRAFICTTLAVCGRYVADGIMTGEKGIWILYRRILR